MWHSETYAHYGVLTGNQSKWEKWFQTKSQEILKNSWKRGFQIKIDLWIFKEVVYKINERHKNLTWWTPWIRNWWRISLLKVVKRESHENQLFWCQLYLEWDNHLLLKERLLSWQVHHIEIELWRSYQIWQFRGRTSQAVKWTKVEKYLSHIKATFHFQKKNELS